MGVIIQLEPDILECEVKWALESIAMNKASGGDGIPVVLEASMRNSAHGKGHEEGGSALHKGEIKPQETPCSQASTP